MCFQVVLMPSLSYAATATGNDIGTAMCSIVGLLTGKVGKAIATMAIVFLAFGLFVGKLSWGVAVATGAGIAAIFGAGTIIELVSGDGTDSCTDVTSNP